MSNHDERVKEIERNAMVRALTRRVKELAMENESLQRDLANAANALATLDAK